MTVAPQSACLFSTQTLHFAYASATQKCSAHPDRKPKRAAKRKRDLDLHQKQMISANDLAPSIPELRTFAANGSAGKCGIMFSEQENIALRPSPRRVVLPFGQHILTCKIRCRWHFTFAGPVVQGWLVCQKKGLKKTDLSHNRQLIRSWAAGIIWASDECL